MADQGYFGPDSITWRVHSEPLVMVGGLRALLLQALHPQAMALLAARSQFRDDPFARLQRTARYVATVSFGSRAEVDAAAAQVRDVHRRLGIDDPEQLAWVHACEVDSFLVAADRLGVGLDAAATDRYLAEQAVAARLVGVPSGLVPDAAAELAAFMSEMRPRLGVTSQARRAALTVVAPPMPVPVRWRLPARLGWTTISTIAVGLLPGWARWMYGLPTLPGTDLTTTAGLRLLRRAVATLPREWREGPAYRAARERLAG